MIKIEDLTKSQKAWLCTGSHIEPFIVKGMFFWTKFKAFWNLDRLCWLALLLWWCSPPHPPFLRRVLRGATEILQTRNQQYCAFIERKTKIYYKEIFKTSLESLECTTRQISNVDEIAFSYLPGPSPLHVIYLVEYLKSWNYSVCPFHHMTTV